MAEHGAGGWHADLVRTDALIHHDLDSRLERLAEAAWSRRAVQAEAALAQSRAQTAMYDRLLRDVLARHDELAAEVEGRTLEPRPTTAHADGGGPAADDGTAPGDPGAEAAAAVPAAAAQSDGTTGPGAAAQLAATEHAAALEARLAEVLASPRWRIGGLLTAPARPVVRTLRRRRLRRGDAL